MEILIAVLLVVVIALLLEGRFRVSDYRTEVEKLAHGREARSRADIGLIELYRQTKAAEREGAIKLEDNKDGTAAVLFNFKPKKTRKKK